MTGAVVWLTGLPGAGKTTLARRLAAHLRHLGRACLVLDSDEVRHVFDQAQDYSEQAREAFYRTLGRLAGLIARQDVVVIVAATASRRLFREWARAESPRFLEVYLQTSRQECERRDAKGLYADARAGLISNLPGVDAVFEIPLHPDIVTDGGLDDSSLQSILRALT